MMQRREFVRDMAIAGATGTLGLSSDLLAAEALPETQRLRLGQITSNCYAPQYVAQDMLRAEGFADLRYVRVENSAQLYRALIAGEIDMTMAFIAPFVLYADTNPSIMMLAGTHPGCQELFGTRRVQSVRDLKGKTVGIQGVNAASHVFVASMAAHVGLDAQRDINWVVMPNAELLRALAEERIDAFMSGPPASYEAHDKGIGHVVVNMTTDRPWSAYFCCVMTSNRDFIRQHPVATKRAMRAILKAADLCAASPESSARAMVSGGFAPNPGHAQRLLRDLPYGRWRDFDTEDSVRYYALRLKESGFIKSSPKKILAENTDWRFLNELRNELKS